MPTQIKEAIVLWYDIARQGCTNENMAKNPVLRDLSGNGHDATCFNFAWDGMSGVGGYRYSFTPAIAFNGNVEYNTNNTTVVITNTGTGTFGFWQTPIPSQEVSHSYKIRITGITGSGLSLSSNLSGMPFNQISEDGEYVIPEWFNSTEEVQWPGLRFTEDYNNQSCNITIELLPEYPYALVSDGVDDYCFVEGLPILDDFTIIAKRNYISGQTYSPIASKFKNSSEDKDGAFVFEIKFNSEINAINCIKSFGELSGAYKVPSEISYMTPKSYNGAPINRGSETDGDALTLFRLRLNDIYMAAALYSFILFDRTLTTEEIEWVKRNLI